MNVKEAIKILEKFPEQHILRMADSMEIVSIVHSNTNCAVYVSDEVQDDENEPESYEEKYPHAIFGMVLNTNECNIEDLLSNLELTMEAAGLFLWREIDEPIGRFFEENNKYPYLIFDAPSWTLSSGDDNSYFGTEVSIEEFLAALEDYKKTVNPYLVVVSSNGEDGHTEKLELELVMYDPKTTEDVDDTIHLKFKNLLLLRMMEKRVNENRYTYDTLAASYEEVVGSVKVEDEV